MKELKQKRAEALAWGYFRVILPVSRECFKDKYKEASDRMRPEVHPSNTKGEFMDMRNFYHDLLDMNPEWAFTGEVSAWRPKRPNRGSGRVRPASSGKRCCLPADPSKGSFSCPGILFNVK